jgi:hypothetical protein
MGCYQQPVVFAGVEVNDGAGGIAADAVGNQPLLLDTPFQGAPVFLTEIIQPEYLPK